MTVKLALSHACSAELGPAAAAVDNVSEDMMMMMLV